MIHPPEFRNRVLADYHASTDSIAAVARRHSLSHSTLLNWLNTETDIALTDGRWVPRGGVLRWEPSW